MSEDHLIVQYRMTVSDWAAFNLYHFSRSAVIWAVWAALVYFTAKGQLHSTPGLRSFGHVVFIGFSAAVTVSVVFVPFLAMVIAISLFSRRRGNILTEHTLQITDEGIVEQTSQTRHETRWPGVQKLGVTPRHLFLYLGPSAAHVIPRRAASDEAMWQRIVAACRTRHAAVRA